MNAGRDHVCPVGLSGSLDNKIRKWLQNPRKILGPYIDMGMTVLDLGCGPGFFSVEMAHLVGESGRVIASDLQAGMLQKLRTKIEGTELENRITLHQCQKDKIGVSAKVDFVLAFYMVHEVRNKEAFFKEIASILKPDGQVLLVEPPLHVSKAAFAETIRTAQGVGLTPTDRPNIRFSKTAVLRSAVEKTSPTG
ncbi:MAG: class I SAM-dependent methyltransferase [Desulfatitalea sp.]